MRQANLWVVAILLGACGSTATRETSSSGPVVSSEPLPPVADVEVPAASTEDIVPTAEDYEVVATETVTAENLDAKLDELEKEIGK